MYSIMNDKCGGDNYLNFRWADVKSGRTTIAAAGHCNKYWWQRKGSDSRYMMRNTPPAIRRKCNYREPDEHGNLLDPGIFRNACKCYKIPLKKCPLTTSERVTRFLNLIRNNTGTGRGKKKVKLKRKTRKLSKRYTKRKIPKKFNKKSRRAR